MKNVTRILLTIALNLGSVLWLFSQDYGAQWIQGPGYASVMDFRNDTVTFHAVNDSASMFVGTANICDRQGNFLFFTNGIYVRNRYGNIMPNGDSLNYNAEWYSAFNSIYNSVYPNGSPSDQSALIIPKPGSESQYYIFHYLTADTSYFKFNMVNYAPLVLYYSLVDINANFGLGEVVQKNMQLPIYQPMCSSRMTAVKHANGRDWWLIRHGDRDSTYIKFLITPDTIAGPYFQKIGPPFNRDGAVQDFRGTSVFNLTGDKMATANFWGPIVVLDFDRCNGEFSNPLVIRNKLYDTTWIGATSLAISPNGRFLYANNTYELNQYDLWAANVNDSVRLYTIDSTDGYWLGTMELAPNNKIYVSTWNGGTSHLHVINSPNEYAAACNFQFNEQQCIALNTNNLPNMVNYKLGPLAGSGCDTLISSVQEVASNNRCQIDLNPNPATVQVAVSIKGNLQGMLLTSYNALGQIIAEQPAGKYQILDISTWPAGLYNISISRNGTLISSQRLVVSK